MSDEDIQVKYEKLLDGLSTDNIALVLTEGGASYGAAVYDAHRLRSRLGLPREFPQKGRLGWG